MNVFFKLYLLILLFVGFHGYAQDIEISGKIVDIKSKEPIPFANIAIKEIYKGTASNALGDFLFKVDSLPIVLVISHLSYEPIEIEITDNNPIIIELNPGKLLMDELVIKAKGNENFAYNLMSKAYYKIIRRYSGNQYGKAFYRQISKNGDEYSELYEIFFDTRFGRNGIDDWAIQEGRYALKLSSVDSFIYNKNFTLMLRLLTIVQPKTDDLVMPVSRETREQYDLNTVRILSVNGRKVAQISFTVKEEVQKPAMEGSILIDVDSYDVLKINGIIANDNLKFISLKGKRGSWKNYQVSCEIVFKPIEDEKLVLDYVRLGQNFEYFLDDIFVNKVETKSFLTFYEYYTPPKKKRLGGRLLRFNRRDSDILDVIGYNQSFWDENQIIKRTPIESEVIASFEASRAFGSIYLNSKNQIILEDYEIDKDPFIVNVKKKLLEYDMPGLGEKVYLHHDKPFYSAGEKLWFKAYLVNMVTNIFSNYNSVLHVDLVSPTGEIMVSNMFQVNKGHSHGQIRLPKDLESGQYKLVAYTHWMKNFSEKLYYHEDLEIYNPSESSGTLNVTKIDSVNRIEFNPEGGILIESIPMQVGFAATDRFGKGMDVKGRLIEKNGRMVATIKSSYNGSGSIFMLPKTEQSYRVLIMSDEVDKAYFPKVKSTGYSIMVNNLKEHTIDVTVRAGLKLDGEKFYILVISNGVLFDRKIGVLTRGLFKTEIPKSNLPTGISQILIVDESGMIQCKRLVFVSQPEDTSIKYYLAKKEIKRNERIDIVLEVRNENGKPLNGASLSVSVLDKDKLSRIEGKRSIRSYFNLEYITDKRINFPNELFGDSDRELLKKMDLVMLNQKSVIPDIPSFDTLSMTEKLNYNQERGLVISGIAMQKGKNEPLSDGFLTIISYPDPSKGYWYTSTDEQGRFVLQDMIVSDSSKVVIEARDSNNTVLEAEIRFDALEKYHVNIPLKTVAVNIPAYGQNYLKDIKRIHNEMQAYQYDVRVTYDELNFKDQKMDAPYGRPDRIIEIDRKFDEFEDMYQVLKGKIPGITATTKDDGLNLRLKGATGTPLIIVDGLIFNSPGNASNSSIDQELGENYSTRMLRQLVPEDVDRVEVIRQLNNASLYGAAPENGAIVIITKPERNPYLRPGANGVSENWLPGFIKPEVFVAPDHSKDDEKDFKPDIRTTIYWNPQIITNRRGRAKISFYNSDEARNLQICIEGLSKDGIPVFDIHDIGRNVNRSQGN